MLFVYNYKVAVVLSLTDKNFDKYLDISHVSFSGYGLTVLYLTAVILS